MKYMVDLIDETDRLSEEHEKLVTEVLQHSCAYERIPEGSEISVTFVENDVIQNLNKDYRDKDEATDVLTFALNEGEEEALNVDQDIPDLLGDIVISIPKAEEQAGAYGHSLERELAFLAVHGFLHMLGYDHGTKEEEEEMFARQETILTEFGLGR
ncbi:putative rRNA maturation factor [Salsuginibacillus halophilus]|uniref:Endoribonuclease YbeY n=1 Tax=Salsuginibacillus halophilus TaxID=517424 RepID=A0A2P8HFP4_9BACI|nr:rRNA maturation RNase YbeY [Salsuginibacillus halophilus]PSL45021.1 putative rRNA maturation factor [Salsuginibacillus halophilus]